MPAWPEQPLSWAKGRAVSLRSLGLLAIHGLSLDLLFLRSRQVRTQLVESVRLKRYQYRHEKRELGHQIKAWRNLSSRGLVFMGRVFWEQKDCLI